MLCVVTLCWLVGCCCLVVVGGCSVVEVVVVIVGVCCVLLVVAFVFLWLFAVLFCFLFFVCRTLSLAVVGYCWLLLVVVVCCLVFGVLVLLFGLRCYCSLFVLLCVDVDLLDVLGFVLFWVVG